MEVLTIVILINLFVFVILLPVIIISFMIAKTIGFKGLLKYHKVYRGRNDGLVLGRVYKEEGTTDYVVLKKTSARTLQGQVNPKDPKSTFIIDNAFVYYNEMKLPTCDYFEKDIEPRSFKSNRDFVTDPKTYDNIWFNAVKSNDSAQENKLLKNPIVIGIFIFLGLIILALIIWNFNINDKFVELAIQEAKSKVITT